MPGGSVAILVLQLIIATALIVGLAILIHRKLGMDPFIFICLATAGAILIDLMNASYLQKQSILGYDLLWELDFMELEMNTWGS
ncbi:hypothetical protein N752_26830 [Desulforamulus aquiferis]|nr:hypothetical protein [Desulforamulus aquiferis]RYD02068.1 hypothetical protein N752_26830 [Desulforamulus aquiferis]